MSADEHLSPRQFTEVHRGLSFGEVSAEEAEEFHRNPMQYMNAGRGNYGIHWSWDPGSAYNFATNRDSEGYVHEDYGGEDEEPGHQIGVVMHGRVRNSSIVQPGTQEWEDYADMNAILHEGSNEAETTIREGSPVRIGKITAISMSPEGRERFTRHRGLGTRRA